MRGIRGRRDATHAPIREELRKRGWSVEDIGDAGNGCPDLIVGKSGETYLIEAKAPGKDPDPRQSTKRLTWRGGPWLVARSVEDVLSEHRRRGHAA